jgi:DNA repair exonuclease SbcCD ATPase subunit
MPESIGVSLLESGLWIIPLAILLVLVGLALRLRGIEGEIYQRIKPLPSRLRAAASALREISALTARYSGLEREPFRSQGRELAALLDEAGGTAAQLKQAYVQLQERLRYRRYHWWQLFLGAIFLWGEWQRMANESRHLENAAAALEAMLETARQNSARMQHAGQDLAQRVQDVLAAAAKTGKLLDEMIDNRLGGPLFEELVSREEALAERLAEIPEVFLRRDDDARTRQAETALIADAYEILAEAQPETEALQTQLSAWVMEYQAARQAAAAAQARQDACQQQLAALPETLNASRQAARLKEIESQAENLLRELSAPDAARLQALAQEAAGLSRQVEQVSAELRQGRRQFLSLTALLEEVVGTQQQLIDVFTKAAKHARLPLQWEAGRERLVSLNRQMSSLGAPDTPRELDLVAAQLDQVHQLRHEQAELYEYCRSTFAQQERLAGLLESLPAAQALAAVEAGHALARQADSYAAVNWPRKDQVETLQADLIAHESRLRSMLPAEGPHPILESDLEDYLLSVEELAEVQQRLAERLASIEQGLAELRRSEQSARDRLQALRTVLSQVSGLCSGNEVLSEISRTKIDAMRREAEQHGHALELRRQGSLEKKVGAVEHLVEELERQAAGWLNQVNQDIERMKNALAEKVNRLQAIARLDDVEIERAGNILRQDIQASVAGKSRQEVRLSLEEIVPQLKPRNDLWQDSRIALAKLSERVEKPLVEAFQHADEQRRLAEERLANLLPRASGRRSWPPDAVSIEELLPDAERLEGRWREIRTQPAQAIWIVRRYGELAVAYRSLAEHLGQLERQAELDQTRIRAHEAELSALLRKWELQEQSLNGDTAAVGRLRQLRSSVERRVQEVKRRWERESPTSPGGITYPQIPKFFEDVINETKRARLLAGDEQAGWREIDIDGVASTIAAPQRDSRTS